MFVITEVQLKLKVRGEPVLLDVKVVTEIPAAVVPSLEYFREFLGHLPSDSTCEQWDKWDKLMTTDIPQQIRCSLARLIRKQRGAYVSTHAVSWEILDYKTREL